MIMIMRRLEAIGGGSLLEGGEDLGEADVEHLWRAGWMDGWKDGWIDG